MHHGAGMRPGPGARPTLPVALILTGSVLLASGLATAGVPSSDSGFATAAGSTVFLYVNATEAISFVPDELSVEPGQSVHLVVTQLADFNHTFTLSPLANFTFPTSDSTADLDAFFAQHAPIVNLSLGSTMGAKFYANFTAPPVGTYEFVCLENDHFSQGMHGELDSGVSTGASTSSPPYTLYLIAAVVVVAFVVAVAALWARRHRTPPA